MHGQSLLEEEEEEEEIEEEVLDQENSIPNIGRKKGYTDLSVPIKQFWQHHMERLMSELEEAERNKPTAAKQIQAPKDTISQLRTKEHMTLSDMDTLTKQKELLLHKLNTFEDTNQTLRDLLEEGNSCEPGWATPPHQGLSDMDVIWEPLACTGHGNSTSKPDQRDAISL